MKRYLALVALVAPAVVRAQDVPKPAALTPVPKPASNISIPFEKYTLPNGLTVILSQDKSAPVVTVNVAYHVGSKNEVAGRTGFAHLFEHVMFTGSGHVPYGMHDRLTEGVGGFNNGTTSSDMTLYFESVPANYLETALWMEADRMGWLLDKLDTAKYNAQRSIVQQERRQRVDNVPYGRANEIIASHMYPSTHPYSWSTIGHLEDLQAAPIEAVKEFFRKYYTPGNATVAIVGDFEPAQAKAIVRKYFAELPRGEEIPRPHPAPVTLSAEERLTFVDSAVSSTPNLFISWPSASLKSDDRYALNALGAILAGSRTARLTQALVYERELAASIDAGQSSQEDAGRFNIRITPRPGVPLTRLEAITDSIIDRLKRDGPTADEVTRVKAGDELNFIVGLESNLTRAITLASSEAFFGDPARSFKVDYPKQQAVSASDIRRVANKYLTKGRIVLSVVPPGGTDKASKAGESTVVSGPKKGGR